MHRDLNDIIPPSRRKAMDMGPAQSAAPSGPTMDMRPAAPAPMRESAPLEPMQAAAPMPKMPRRKRFSFGGGRGFPIGTALIAVLVIVACGVVLYAFQGAKVTITPVMNSATVATDLTATLGTGDLPFQLVTVEKTASANVPAESTVTASDPASGKITITNRQTKAQGLIKNTRFQTADGLVFRVRDTVSIPAGGSITTTVYADEAGDKYNIGPTSFTVPGLKGSAAFDQVTAKSDAPMTGGFSGTRPSVAQATKDKQYADMQGKLSAELAKELATKVPEGYIMLPGSSFTTFTPGTDAAGASGTVALSETGKVIAVVFPAEALARNIAFKSVGTYGGQPVTLKSVEGLTVKPVQPTIAPDATEFAFNLSGSTTIVWIVDSGKISSAVAGKDRNSAKIALESFPEVGKATLVLRPFWAQHFPGDPAKIKVSVTDQPAGK